MGGWPVVIYTAQSRSWSRDYQEQSQIVAGWRLWTRDLQISNPAPWTTRTRCLPSNALHFKYRLVWSKRTISNLQRSRWWYLRATAYKYWESHDRRENSDFLLLCQKDAFGELFSEIYFQSSSEFTFLWNLGKFEIPLNQPRWPMEFVQNCTFSTRQHRKKGTCLDFIFTRFVIYPLVILLSWKSSWSKYVLSTSWPFEKYNYRNLIYK